MSFFGLLTLYSSIYSRQSSGEQVLRLVVLRSCSQNVPHLAPQFLLSQDQIPVLGRLFSGVVQWIGPLLPRDYRKTRLLLSFFLGTDLLALHLLCEKSRVEGFSAASIRALARVSEDRGKVRLSLALPSFRRSATDHAVHALVGYRSLCSPQIGPTPTCGQFSQKFLVCIPVELPCPLEELLRVLSRLKRG